MSIQAHIDSLAEKHEFLEQKIAQEMHHPMPNFTIITGMKKQKLAIKQEMQRYLAKLNEEPINATS